MKVLMLIYRMNIGGTEHYVLNLARSLMSQGIGVGIATTGGPLVHTLKELGIPVHLLPFKGFAKKNLSRLRRVIKSRSYSVIHAHDTYSFRLAAALKQICRIPLVLTIHGRYHGRPALIAAARKADKIITVTPRLKEWILALKIRAAKCVVIPIGIHTGRFRPYSRPRCRRILSLPQKAEIVAYASRFSKDKYPIARKLISAGEAVARIRKRSLFILAGPGAYQNRLQRYARLANRRIGRQAIFVVPAMKQIWNLYAASDIVVGTGTVANEAMACERALIAAGVKGYYGIITPLNLREAIINQFGDHGARKPVRSANLARDITYLLAKRGLAKSLGKMGRDITVRKYSIKVISRRVRKLYTTISPHPAT